MANKYIEKTVLQSLLTKMVAKNDGRYLLKGAQALEAAKVANALTINGETYDGSAAKAFNLSESGHKHAAADISDFSAAVQKVITDSQGSVHTHSNLSTLEQVTDAKIAAWDAKIGKGDVAKITYSNTGMSGVSDVKAALDVLVKNAQINSAVISEATTNMETVSAKADAAATAASTEETRAIGKENELAAAIEAMKNADTEGSLANKIAANTTAITTAQGEIDALEGVVDTKAAAADLTAAVGRIATAEGKITDLEAEQDTQDAAIAAAKSAADTAQADVDALEAKVGTIEEGKTVVEMIEAAKTAATYDDTALTNRVTAAEGAIDAIEDDYLKAADKTELEGKITTAQSAAEAAAQAAADAQADIDAFMAAAEVGEAAVDTLKEIQDYIESDGEAAAALTNRVAANETAIAAINNADTGILAQAKADAAEKDAVLKSELQTEIDQDVAAAQATLQANIDKKVNQSAYDEKVAELAQADTDNLAAAKSYAEAQDTALHTTISAEIDNDVKVVADDLADEVARAQAAEKANADAIDALEAALGLGDGADSVADQIAALDERLDTAEGEIDALQTDIATKAAAADVADLQDRMTIAERGISTNAQSIKDLQDAVATFDTLEESELDAMLAQVYGETTN